MRYVLIGCSRMVHPLVKVFPSGEKGPQEKWKTALVIKLILESDHEMKGHGKFMVVHQCLAHLELYFALGFLFARLEFQQLSVVKTILNLPR